jgi:solute carrier family 13 (sodium-dependent dicarboxylate transporter), member 2/3/5
MKLKTILGLSFGILGFLLPFIIKFNGLSFAGHIALGIFLMAAMFWLFEPIPIFSTSLLVIFLGVILLSSQGLVFQNAELPNVKPVLVSGQVWEVPAKAVTPNSEVFIVSGKGESAPLKVSIVNKGSEKTQIQSDKILPETKIVSESDNKLAGYKPAPSSDYFNSLANTIIILFLGGLLLADAATKYNLDKNLTRVILKPFGKNPSFITLGMLSVTAIVSAFMSNTAATAMMMTVVLPIIAQLKTDDPFKKAVVLAIPFGANIGGIATPVGTPPNAVVLAALSKQGIVIPFGSWVIMAAPLAIIMVIFTWWLLIKLFPPSMDKFELQMEGAFEKSPKAIILYIIFGLTIIFWVTEALHGISSSLIAFFAVAALTVTRVVDEEDVQKIPWDVLWLVSGGIALDVAMRSTGMGVWLVSNVAWSQLGSMSVLIVFALVAILMSTFLSHTVTSTILAPLAVGIGMSGALGGNASIAIAVMVVGIGTSWAMSLPISTPPNAIATSTGIIDTKSMAKAGVWIGIVGIILLLLFARFYWPLIIH